MKKKERNRWATKQSQHGNGNVFVFCFLNLLHLLKTEIKRADSGNEATGGGCLEGEVETG